MGGRGHAQAPSGRVELFTPPEVLQLVYAFFGGPPAMDPTGHPESPVEADVHVLLPKYRQQVGDLEGVVYGDALKLSWGATNFCNPPYTRKDNPRFARKMLNEWRTNNAESINLVPCAPCTKWWKPNWAGLVCFWEGRLRYIGERAKADFENALVYHGPHPERFAKVFGPYGTIR